MATISIIDAEDRKNESKKENTLSEYAMQFLLVNGYSRIYLLNNDIIIHIILHYYSSYNKYKACDIYELFNALQFDSRYDAKYDTKYQNGFIDLRSKNEYEKQSIFSAINIPFSIHKNLENLQSISFKNIYLFSSNKELYQTIKIRKDLKFDKNIHSIVVLNTNFNTFYVKFPYLCCSEKERVHINNSELAKFAPYPNHILNDSLFLGAIHSAKTKYILQNLKITHVINT